MPQYLGRFRYTSDSVRAMIADPQDREAAARELVESLGGKLLGLWFAFGDHDGVFIADVPDNATMTAVAMAVGGSGAMSSLETTVLIGMDEAQDAMRKAASAGYRPPAA
jgi:uncharacterized protein with GYD domain